MTSLHLAMFPQVCDSGPQDHMPLLVAAGNGHSDIVLLLLKHGADCNAQVGHVMSCDLSQQPSTLF